MFHLLPLNIIRKMCLHHCVQILNTLILYISRNGDLCVTADWQKATIECLSLFYYL